MRLIEILRLVWLNLAQNKSKVILTSIGIVAGSATIMMVLAIGKGGQMIKKIGSAARYEIEELLESKVNLKLWTKVRKDWRDSDILLKNFGYDRSVMGKETGDGKL